MSEVFDIYTLLFLVLAVVIFIRLRGVLGRRTGDERPPYDPYTRPDAKQAGAPEGTVVTLPRGRAGQPVDEAGAPSQADIDERLERSPRCIRLARAWRWSGVLPATVVGGGYSTLLSIQ